MTTSTTSATQQLLNNVLLYNLNPSSIQQNVLNILEMALAGDDIISADSPFIFLMESSATCTAAAISASESAMRKQYPYLAQTQNELFNHMSDTDYIGIYATGARSTINVLVPYQQLLAAAIYVNNSLNVKTVTIPRDTIITANGIDMAIGYTININILSNNTILVLYDTSIINPLLSVSVNKLQSTVIVYGGAQYLQIVVPVIQYTNSSTVFSLNSTSSFYQTINFTGQYYYTRVYINTGNNVWNEIATTFSPMVYDITKPTLLLSVDGTTQQLTVQLPDIYQTLNTSGNSIRVDVYTTQGVLDVDLSQMPTSSFSATWKDFDTLNPNPGVAPLSKINDIIFYSNTSVSGGTNAVSLDVVRQRVIYHINDTIAPIRTGDISIGLGSLGYTVQKIIDSVTDRVFLASKNLPQIVVNGLTNIPLASNTTVNFNLSGGISGGGYNNSIITHSVARSTIMPATIYSISNGNVSILSDSQLAAIQQMSPSTLCTYINAGMYMYSPFHYIIDYTLPVMTTRPYYLTGPIITGRTSVAVNTARNYNITTISAAIELIGHSYVLTLTTSIPTGITGVYSQISYTDPASNTTIYLNGVSTILNSTAIFTFTLNTNFDINQFDQIEFLNMFNTLNNTSQVFMDITSSFNIFYLVAGSNAGLTTAFDNLYFVSANMPAVIGATQETITIQFGQSLATLYCPSSQILATDAIQTYKNIVYATYPEVVYESGPNGYIYTIHTDGSITFTILHNAGDPVLDSNGNQIILHNVGDPILDVNGNTIPIVGYLNSTRQLVGITMIDAKYNLATSATATAYNGAIPDVILGYLNNELAPVAGQLNERTQLFYAPMGETTTLSVLIGNGITVQVPSVLDIQITFYLTKVDATNPDIIASINTIARTVISTQVSQPTISLSVFIEELSNALPATVVGFNVDKFLPNGYPVVTLINPSLGFVVGEELTVLPDGTLDVVDTIKLLYDSAT